MAGDVHKAIHKVLGSEGNLSVQEAEEFLENLEKMSRYQRDVWVT